MATAGEPTQLVVTPYDDFGNMANVTTAASYSIVVEAISGGRQRRRLIQSAEDPVIEDVSWTLQKKNRLQSMPIYIADSRASEKRDGDYCVLQCHCCRQL